MARFYLNYADATYARAQRYAARKARATQAFNQVFCFGPRDIGRDFFQKNQSILSADRGAGFWLWKPYLMHRVLQRASAGDIVFYLDSGAHLIADPAPFFAATRAAGGFGIVEHVPDLARRGRYLYGPKLLERKWTKRIAFQIVGVDTAEARQSHQRNAAMIAFVKTPDTLRFVREWLDLCQDPMALTDAPGPIPNFRGFKDHRHDQSLLSLLSKKYRLPTLRDPSQYGNHAVDHFSNSPYPQLVHHHRDPQIGRKAAWWTGKQEAARA